MGKIARFAAYGIGAILLLALLAAAGIWAVSARTLGQRLTGHPERLAPASAASLELGQRLLYTHGCLDCHGSGLRGAKFLDIPNVATLYAPNLTLLAAKVDDQQLARGIRQGIGHDGRPLLIMPSTAFFNLTDEETRALVQAIRAQPKGGSEQPALALGPLGRIGIANGKLPTIPDAIKAYRAAPPVDLGPRFAAGRHTAMTICADCHGSNLTGKEFEPGQVAPDMDIAGAYDLPAFTRLLRTGVPPGGRDLHVMDDISRKDFSHFTDQEIADLHAYLQARASR